MACPLPRLIQRRDTVEPELFFQGDTMIEFLVEGMTCAHCVNTVTEAIHALDPAATVDVDLGTKLVQVRSALDRFVLSQAIVDAGYDPIPVGLESADRNL